MSYQPPSVPTPPAVGGSGLSPITSRLLAYGHSYLAGGGTTHLDRQFITLLAGALRCDLRDLGVGASMAAADNLWLPQGANAFNGYGGWAWVMQNVSPYSLGAPYTPATQSLPIMVWGINDIVQHAGNAGAPDQIFKSAVRASVSRLCAARAFESNDSSIATAGGNPFWQTKGDTNKNSGVAYRPIPNDQATVTITLPADFEGGSIGILLLAWPASDGTITWTGTASQLPLTTSLSGMAYATNGAGMQRSSSNAVLARITGLTAADAGRTIIGTYNVGAGTRFLSAPGPGVITQVGTAGTTTYSYQRFYMTYNGLTLQGGQTTNTGNATLSGTNYNVIPAGPAWQSGVEQEILCRTAGGSAQGVIAVLTAPAIVNDQGGTPSGATPTPPTLNPYVGAAAYNSWWIESNNPITRGVILNIPVPPAAWQASTGITPAQIATYNQRLQEVATEFGWLYVDIDTPLASNPALFAAQPDPHMNNRGHAVVSDTAYKKITSWASSIPTVDQHTQARVGRKVSARTSVIRQAGMAGVGNYVIPGGNVWGDVDPINLQLSIDAQVGDFLEVDLAGSWAPSANTAILDVVTVTPSGTPIAYFATGTSTGGSIGWPSWYGNNLPSGFSTIAGTAVHQVTAADIQTLNTVQGIVIVRLQANSTAGRTLYAGGSNSPPLSIRLRNAGAANTPGFNAS